MIRAEYPLHLIHSDICDPMNVRARHRGVYFGFVYLISHKSEALECFKRYLNLVENQFDRKVKALRIDRGR